MARSKRRARLTLSQQLLAEPHRFEFFQAVRLLAWTRIAAGQHREVNAAPTSALELLRFRAWPGLRFTGSEVIRLEPGVQAEEGAASGPAVLWVGFFGLIGPSGVLPEHYTRLVIERNRRNDPALGEFLDLFNQRSLSLFFGAQEKYRLPFAWERAHRGTPSTDGAGRGDPYTDLLRSLTGLRGTAVQRRLAVPDEFMLHFAGHLARRPRSALALRGLLENLLGLPVEVVQFQGCWLYLETEQQTRLWGSGESDDFQTLNGGALAGERVWSVRSRFRLRIGPLSLAQFQALMPGSPRLRALCDLTRLFVGPELGFDVQPVLRDEEIPDCQLDAGEPGRLGWGSWLGHGPGGDGGDAFVLDADRLAG